MTKEEIEAMIQAFLAKHNGDANKALTFLYTDNHDLREKNRGLKAELDAASTGTPDPKLVLTAEQLADFAKYQALGSPDDLKKSLDAGKAYETEITGLKRGQLLTDVSGILNYNPEVLKRLAEGHELRIEDTKVTENGETKPVKVVSIKDGDKFVALDGYAAEKWSDFLPSLRKSSEDAGNNRVNYPAQGSQAGGQGSSGNLVDSFIADMNKAPAGYVNPLDAL